MVAVAPRIEPMTNAPILFAHRGASAVEPDNTIPAFRLALELGANGLESDVWLSADGHAVLAHDSKVGSFGRRRRIAELTVAELPADVPTLERFFTEVGCDFDLSLDLKDPNAFEATVDVLRRVGDQHSRDLPGRTWLCHPDVATVRGWRERAADVRLVHSTRLKRLAVAPEQHGRELSDSGIDAVNFRFDAWNGGLTTLYHRFGLYCFGWDTQLTRVAAELLDMGVDAIYGNHVDRLLAARLATWGY